MADKTTPATERTELTYPRMVEEKGVRMVLMDANGKARVAVPDADIILGLERVRTNRRAPNMLEFNAAQRLAYELNEYKLVAWMEENHSAYGRLIFSGCAVDLANTEGDDGKELAALKAEGRQSEGQRHDTAEFKRNVPTRIAEDDELEFEGDDDTDDE